MGALPALVVHLALTLAAGAALLAACGAAAGPGLLAEAWLLGLFAETSLAAALLVLGLPLPAALGAAWAAGLAGLGLVLWKRRGVLVLSRPPRPTWCEWALLAVLAEKLWSVGHALAASPIIFDDALSAWAGRARSIYGGVNFSLVQDSPTFLGFTGPRDYPLASPLWNAGTAMLAGAWDDALARADAGLAWAALAGVLWSATLRATGSRRHASLAGLAALLLPFPFWHALAGYGDLLTGAAATACLALLCRGAYLPAGLAAAAAVWAKNDALYVFVPALLLACLLRTYPVRDLFCLRLSGPGRAKSLGLFLAGLAACAPWLAFRAWAVEGVLVSPPAALALAGASLAVAGAALVLRRSPSPLAARVRAALAAAALPALAAAAALVLVPVALRRLEAADLSWHAEAPGLFLAMLAQPTHAVLWPGAAALLLAGSPRLLRDGQGRALLAAFLAALATVFFIYAWTPAFEYLLLETTVHRSLLQLYGPALLGAFYGLAPAGPPGLVHSRINITIH